MKEDNHIKQKLYHHTMPVRDGLWEAIEAKLPAERSSRRLPLFWFILFGCAAMGGAIMFSTFPKNTSTAVPVTHEDISGIPSQEVQSSQLHDPAIIGHDQQQSNAIEPRDVQDDLDPQSAISASTSSTPGSLQQAQSAIASHNHLSSASDSRQGAQNQTPQSSILKSLIPSTQLVAESTPHLTSDASNSLHAFSGHMPDGRITDFLPLSSSTLVTSDEEAESIEGLSPDPNCYKFGPSGLGFAMSADLFFGPGFSPRNFEDSAGESSIYADARSSTERHQYAWSAGGRINLHLSNGLGARLGILYHQSGDRFDYQDSLAMQSTTRVDSFWSANGTFLYADTVRVFIPGTLIKKIHNTYRQVDIPLLLSYEMPMGKAVLMLNAGPVLNVASSQRGQILDPMLNPRVLAPGGAPTNRVDVYKSSLGLSFYLGAGAIVPMQNNFSLLIEPRLLYRIKPVTLDSYLLKEHRHFAALHLGLRYHFK